MDKKDIFDYNWLKTQEGLKGVEWSAETVEIKTERLEEIRALIRKHLKLKLDSELSNISPLLSPDMYLTVNRIHKSFQGG